ncbi:MAG: DnaD domain protein [Dehalococcoidia bacterium]|nr:DnaD domain protein [Dehalococcoidia bacterium]
MNSQPFPGFPARSNLTPLPDLFFSKLLPEMDSLPELKVLLHIFWRLYRKKGNMRFLTREELESDAVLMQGLDTGADTAAVLHEALDAAVNHGFLLHAAVEKDGQSHDLYFINGEASREALARAEAGEISIQPPRPAAPAAKKEEQPNVFVLYEQNIGVLTPMIAEELKEAERLYPAPWIEEAFREAASLNKRSWRYIQRILERWSTEGKGSGESGRDTKKKGSPGRYFKGKYGHLVRR